MLCLLRICYRIKRKKKSTTKGIFDISIVYLLYEYFRSDFVALMKKHFALVKKQNTAQQSKKHINPNTSNSGQHLILRRISVVQVSIYSFLMILFDMIICNDSCDPEQRTVSWSDRLFLSCLIEREPDACKHYPSAYSSC